MLVGVEVDADAGSAGDRGGVHDDLARERSSVASVDGPIPGWGVDRPYVLSRRASVHGVQARVGRRLIDDYPVVLLAAEDVGGALALDADIVISKCSLGVSSRLGIASILREPVSAKDAHRHHNLQAPR